MIHTLHTFRTFNACVARLAHSQQQEDKSERMDKDHPNLMRRQKFKNKFFLKKNIIAICSNKQQKTDRITYEGCEETSYYTRHKK